MLKIIVFKVKIWVFQRLKRRVTQLGRVDPTKNYSDVTTQEFHVTTSLTDCPCRDTGVRCRNTPRSFENLGDYLLCRKTRQRCRDIDMIHVILYFYSPCYDTECPCRNDNTSFTNFHSLECFQVPRNSDFDLPVIF